jgi:NAD(P)-dependent dehydrogenase (short-subunit alcohol dehydrogenase family)
LGECDGRVALVTGASRGIGAAIAQRLASEGAAVAVTARTLDEHPTLPGSLRDTVAAVEGVGGKAVAIAADVSDADDRARIVPEAEAALGPIDILVNNAAAARGSDRVPVLQIPDDEWRRVIDMNLTGTFLVTKAVGKVLVEQGEGGRIINISSIAGRVGMPTFGSYAVTKAGIILLTQVLATELAAHRINVNCVCPGLIGTHRMQDVVRPGAIRDMVMPTIPLGREGSPEEIGEVVAFLAGPGGSYIHGQTINVDGGRVMS